jgi:hypothetical protein
MGLGSLQDVGLADARALAAEGRLALAQGNDPLEAKRDGIKAAQIDAARGVTFKEAAESRRS